MNKIYMMSESSKIILSIKNNNLVMKSTKPVKGFSVNACYIFDLLKENLNIRSKHPGIRRRALQLQGMSLEDIIKKLS